MALVKVSALKSTRSVDVPSLILDTYSRIMQRYLQEKAAVPSNQITELAYDDFVQSPVESLRTAYAQLNQDDFGYCENKLRMFTGKQKHFIQLNHALPAEERKLVSEKLEPVIRHWNYNLL